MKFDKFNEYKKIKNPLAKYIKYLHQDTAKYLKNQLLLKYSPEQIELYMEIHAYIKKLIEIINKAFDEAFNEGVEVEWK